VIERILVVGAVWAGTLVAAGWWAYGAGQNHEIAARSREDRAASASAQIAAAAAAEAISKIEVKHVTLRTHLEREIQTREVFRDCRSGDDARRLLNASPGVAPAASAPGGGELPVSGPAR
jgi:hypothetical protein